MATLQVSNESLSVPMIIEIPDILNPSECEAIRAVLASNASWRDGKATAAGTAKAAKFNEQADTSSPPIRGSIAKIEQALTANATFRAAARPAQFARMLISRYRSGMEYRDHVDAAHIDGLRCDLSFTVFLNEPEEYDGGELVIDNAGHSDRVKGPAGSVVLYPSTSIHCVARVETGERLAAVGWIKSIVRSQEHRTLLFDLEQTLADLPASPARLRLANIRNNLLRLFSD